VNKRVWLYGLLTALVTLAAARASAQFTMPPPAEPVDALPPSSHPLPAHTAPEPVAEACSIRANDIYFEAYSSGQSTDREDSMGMTLSCNEEVRLSITASPSPESPNFDYRLMHQEGGGSATLRYQLYTSYNRLTVWGDGSGESQPYIRTVVPGQTIVDVFGSIFANQNVPPGNYSDDITVTLEVQ
jgi:spore coat protein U-like protein